MQTWGDWKRILILGDRPLFSFMLSCLEATGDPQKTLHCGEKWVRSEKEPTTCRVSSRFPLWFAPHTIVRITNGYDSVNLINSQNFSAGRFPSTIVITATNDLLSSSEISPFAPLTNPDSIPHHRIVTQQRSLVAIMPTANLSAAPKAVSTDLVRTYLQEIGRVPLLTHEQEIYYGKQVQQMMALLTLKADLTTGLDREPTAPEWAEAASLSEGELERQLLQGQRAKRAMIEANLRLVVSIAKKYQKRNMEFLDLLQEGALGLERGVEKFDPTRGYKFSTYAYWWIRQAITRAIAQQSRTVRLPIHITEKLNKIKKTQRELAQELGRRATPKDIAIALEMEPNQVRDYLTVARHPLSLDMRVGDNHDTELSELLEDQDSSPDDYATQESLRQDLQNLIAELTPQQRRVIILRYGLEDGNPLSLAKIGHQLSLSRERVRQLEQQALNQLRKRRARVKEYVAS